MGFVTFFATLAQLLLLCTCMLLCTFVPDAVLGVVVWPFVWLLWRRVGPDQRLPMAFQFQLLPLCISVQMTIDSLVPFLGDAVILVANVAIVSSLSRPRIPRAQVHRS